MINPDLSSPLYKRMKYICNGGFLVARDHRLWSRIDNRSAPIVDMDEQNNRELLLYNKDRQVWRFEPDESPPKLSRYP
jgi:hypothetical protein